MIAGKTLTLLLTGSLVSIAACGGDDSDGSGGGTLTDGSTGETDPTGDTMTTATTASTTMTTTDADSSSGAATTMTTMDTMTTDATDTDTTTGNPGGAVAYRFNSVAVRDPHFFAIGMDVTEGQVNAPLNAALNTDDDGDGLFDLGFILSFDALDQSDGGTGSVTFANVQCMDSADPTSCSLRPSTQEYPTTYTSQAAGTCQEPNAANLGPNYNPTPQSTTGPCFVTTGASVSIATSSFALPMENATVAARYVGDPAGNLVEGSIIGWVSQEAADNAILMGVPLFDGQPVSALLHDDARDDGDTGWWFHIDFTAVPATYE